MVTKSHDALGRATLTAAELRVLRRLLERLQTELADDLHAVWLYGSRARGQEVHAESDVDLMVIADGGQARYGTRAIELVNEVAAAEGASPAWYSLFVCDPAWLDARRQIRSFFIAEVDRDKIVLCGSALQ